MAPAPTGAPVLLVGARAWDEIRDRAVAAVPDIRPVVYTGPDPLPTDELAGVTIGYFSGDTWPGAVAGMARSLLRASGKQLRWVQSFSAGVDNEVFGRLLDNGVRLTTASGTSASPIAQTVVLYMLALSRDLRGFMRDQDARRWNTREIGELDGATLAVVGMGPIGTEVARLGTALGMRVEAVRRRPGSADEPWATRGFGELHGVLGRSDWVVCALPLVEKTRGLFGAAEFAAMRRGARFVNVGRGDLVDEPALVAALQSGHLGGAGLDVFAVEPLPAESPLWAMDNVIITPHSSGESRRADERTHALFLDNLRRWTASQPLVNEVLR
jgi:phosphoglycerate dehydrogenase-like enzyme